MNEQTIHVAFAFDEAYAPHGATAILSLLDNANSSDRLCIYVIDTGLSEESRIKLHTMVADRGELNFLTVPLSFFEGFPTSKHAASTYARLALGQLLPNIKQVIYLDSDLVILDSLSALASVDISDFVIAAAPDAMSFFRGDAVEYWKSVNLPDNAVYFSAGVLVINLDNYRSEGILEEIRNWTKVNSEKMLHSDQTALNVVLWNRAKIIDVRWNLQAPLIGPVVYGWGGSNELHRAFKNPGIVHFTTNRKPWVKKHMVFMANQYWKYRSAVDWESTDPKMSISDLLNRICEEITHQKIFARTCIRWLLGKIPKSN